MAQARPSLALEKHRAVIRDVLAGYNLHAPRLFGSVARGEDNDESDIDILVETRPGVSLFDLAGAEIALTDLMGCPVQIATDRTPKTPFLERIAADLQPI